MNFSKIDSILPNIQPKLSQYQYIIQSIRSANVATDRDFQRHYNGFFVFSAENLSFMRSTTLYLRNIKI